MSDQSTSPNDANLTIRDHMDPDKHWIGETLPAGSLADMAPNSGGANSVGVSPFPARIDHTHSVTASGLFVAKAGDVMTGVLWAPELSSYATNPLISLYAADRTTRYGYFWGDSTSATVELAAEAGARLAFRTGGVIHAAIDTAGNLSTTASIYTNNGNISTSNGSVYSINGPFVAKGGAPYYSFETPAGLRVGFWQSDVAGSRHIFAIENGISSWLFWTPTLGSIWTMETASGRIYAYSDPFAGAGAGGGFSSTGAVGSARYAAGVNCQLFKASGAFGTNQQFIAFYGQTTATVLGTVSMPTSSTIAYNTSSHGPWKGNVTDLDDTDALQRIMKWKPVSYQWKLDETGNTSETGTPTGPVEHGFIAQDLYKVQPSAVTPGYGVQSDLEGWESTPEDENPPFMPWMTDNSKLVPDMAAAMQALIRRVQQLTDRVKVLEANG